MIHIDHNSDCCGCEACAQRCPVQCISMQEDGEGFLYPHVDTQRCIDCGLCEKVCPVLNQSAPRKPLAAYAAKHPDEAVRMSSSSGGVFTALAEAVLARGGVIFGARFDEHWEVVHAYTETLEGLSAFRGSKYVQSRIGESYKACERFLMQGREVLFSGTPCQIAGLRLFLRKEYPDLLTVDVICHGVPSPLVWRKYLENTMRPKGADGKNTVLSFLNEMPVITGISFRNKKLGWKKFGFEIRGMSASKADQNSVLKSGINQEKIALFEPLDKNLFLRGFLANLYLRPSCHLCPARCGRSCSDLTIGDFWGIRNYRPDLDDDKGTSVVLVNSQRGSELLEALQLNKTSMPYDSVLPGNPSLELSSPEPRYREMFWSEFSRTGIAAIDRMCRKQIPRSKRVVQAAKNIVKRIIRYK